jgi:hypothetical protein
MDPEPSSFQDGSNPKNESLQEQVHEYKTKKDTIKKEKKLKHEVLKLQQKLG